MSLQIVVMVLTLACFEGAPHGNDFHGAVLDDGVNSASCGVTVLIGPPMATSFYIAPHSMMVFTAIPCGNGVDIALCGNVVYGTPNGINHSPHGVTASLAPPGVTALTDPPVVQWYQKCLPWQWCQWCSLLSNDIDDHPFGATVFTIPNGNSINGAPCSWWHWLPPIARLHWLLCDDGVDGTPPGNRVKGAPRGK